jgi:hypothetical protein
MKRLVAPLLIGAIFGSFAVAKDMDMKAEIQALKAQMAELKTAQKKINIVALKRELSEVKAHDAHDNIKFSVDFRTAYDIVDYDVNKAPDVSNGVWTNKLTLNMAAQPRDDLVFHGALGVYKTFGVNNAAATNGFQNFDWYASETPSGDANVRLAEAYFLYFGKMGKVPYTVSFGRRPAVDGFLTNLRDDNDNPESPIGHNINMEFDGASFMFNVENITDISGMYFKICLGRGNSNAEAKYPTFTGYMGSGANATLMPSTTHTPYVKGDNDSANMDLAGLLAQLYNDGQYKVMANWFQGWNMMGANFTYKNGTDASGGYDANLVDVGDMTGGVLSVQVDGIGDEISDFLDDTTVFASFAYSKTDPKGSHGAAVDNVGTLGSRTEMLGSSKSETGTSYYVGVQIPGFMDDDRIGFEYNHGSKYWRSFTYGEDTLIGSKLSTRGDAYEAYYNLPLLDRFLTAQIRYTYIDYSYTGSDMFFGSTGTPMDVDTTPGAVKTAQDLRLYLRYRY